MRADRTDSRVAKIEDQPLVRSQFHRFLELSPDGSGPVLRVGTITDLAINGFGQGCQLGLENGLEQWRRVQIELTKPAGLDEYRRIDGRLSLKLPCVGPRQD